LYKPTNKFNQALAFIFSLFSFVISINIKKVLN
jgi:hypothetical protein